MLPQLPPGERYYDVVKAGGIGKKGGGKGMKLHTAETALVLYNLDGSHFKSYQYASLMGWEASNSALILSKAEGKDAMKNALKTVKNANEVVFNCNPGEADEIVGRMQQLTMKLARAQQKEYQKQVQRSLSEKVFTIREVDPNLLGLPQVPEGQPYYACEKVLRAGRHLKGMYVTVGQMGIQFFEGNQHYKTYQFHQLLAWDILDANEKQPNEQCRLSLTKRKDRSLVEFVTDPGAAVRIANALTQKAMSLAKEMKKKGTHAAPVVAKGWLEKSSSKDPRSSIGMWQERYFVLYGGTIPKLQYFESEASYEQQLQDGREEGGIGWLKPKGEMELVQVETGFTGEPMEPGQNMPIFAIRVPTRTLYCRARDNEAKQWMEAIGNTVQKSKAGQKDPDEPKSAALSVDSTPESSPTAASTSATSRFKTGDKVQVFSRSQNAWQAGEIVEIEGPDAKVRYTVGGQVGEKYVEMEDTASIRRAPQKEDFVVDDDADFDDEFENANLGLGQTTTLSSEENDLLEQQRQLVAKVSAKLSAVERQLAAAREEADAQRARADRIQAEAAATSKDAAAQKARAERAEAELKRLRSDPSLPPGSLDTPALRPPVHDTAIRVADFEYEQTQTAIAAARSGRKLTLTERLRLMIAEDDPDFDYSGGLN